MAELVIQERLQPSLLDRLTDNEPQLAQESRQKRVMSTSNLREVMLRDLGWLMNATTMGKLLNREDFPYVSSSVLNFGKPDMTAMHVRDEDLERIESSIRQSILDFEPRILAATLKVRAVLASGKDTTRTLGLEIQGSLWCQPVPLQLYLKTAVDLDTGDVKISNLAF